MQRGAAALAGTFYTGGIFPPTYDGSLFFADYTQGWIKSVRVNGSDQVIGSPSQFADSAGGPVQLDTGPDGALWYLAIGPGDLRKIRFVGSYTPLPCPDGQFRAW